MRPAAASGWLAWTRAKSGNCIRLARQSKAKPRAFSPPQANPQVLDQLRDLIRRNENLTTPSTRDYFVANRCIHRAFMVEAGNKFLLDMFDTIWGNAMAFHLFSAIENVNISKSLGDHLTLVDAIATGDVTEALETFTAHIQAGFELQMEGLKEVEQV